MYITQLLCKAEHLSRIKKNLIIDGKARDLVNNSISASVRDIAVQYIPTYTLYIHPPKFFALISMSRWVRWVEDKGRQMRGKRTFSWNNNSNVATV
jgi:hypothetical protein